MAPPGNGPVDFITNVLSRSEAMLAIGRRGKYPRPNPTVQRRGLLRRYRPCVEILEDRTLLSFITATSYATGADPDAVAAADLLGNGTQDLVVADAPPSVPGTVNV